MRQRRVIFLLFIFSGHCSLVAQTTSYRFAQVTVNTGLSHNQVTSFLRDDKGFLWIGTASGLNRFDGYTMKVFRNDPHDSTSLSDNNVNKIFRLPGNKMGVLTSSGLNIYDPEKERFSTSQESFNKTYGFPGKSIADVITDDQGWWFIHVNGGFSFYEPKKETGFSIRHHHGDTTSIISDSVTSFVYHKGNHWLIHANGVIEKIIFKNGSGNVVYRSYFLHRKNKNRNLNYRLLADADGDLWIFVLNDQQGVYYFNTNSLAFRHFNKDSRTVKLNTNIISSVVQDNTGLLWIGTDHGGVNLLDKRNFSIRYLLHRDEDETALGQNSINTLYKDPEGIIWIGTYKKGVSYYHPDILRFPLYRNNVLDPSSLPYGDVNRFVEDDKGNLWIGTNGGGLIYFDRKKNSFKQYRHNPADRNSLSSDVIVSLCLDHEKKLWIGTYYEGLNCFDGKNFIRYTHDPSDPGSLAERSVWEIYEDSKKRLWIGTLGGGLDLFDRRNSKFSHYRSGEVNSVQSGFISAITEDRNGNLWIGTIQGIDILMESSNRFIHFQNSKSDRNSLSNDNIIDFHEDARGQMWVGTHGGLNLFNNESKSFKAFTMADGLPDNTILTILEDNKSNLWMGTPNGISNMIFSDTGITCKNYDRADGLQGKQFNENAALKTSRDELIFGGANGFNIFKPDQLELNKTLAPVILSDFQLYNKSVKAGEPVEGGIILSKSITETSEITLPSDKNVFSIEFAALNFFHPEKNTYKYKLAGFNKDWLSADGNSRKVTFTNLDPGEYVFKVKAANNDGLWNEKETSLKITILPPFWKTKTALMLYVLFLITILLITRKLIQQREQMKYLIEHERQEAMRMHELDMMKIKFFTNVSHEFRTPLTLILTPLEKMMKLSADPVQQGQFTLMQRNAKRLLNLVNQLLDFRKLEVQEVKYNPSHGDIIGFIKDAVYSFSDLSEKKNIRLDFRCSVESLETLFDQDKLEKILFNLLSNAFKFTPEQGSVSVAVDPSIEGNKKWLIIQVKDSGIGIPPDKKEKIFERFFQHDLPGSLVNQGSGIGLSIIKEFVKVHSGEISVDSEIGKGSNFVVKLPVDEVTRLADSPLIEMNVSPGNKQEDILEWGSETSPSKKPVLLLVEDNEDFRFYLKDNLKLHYKIIEARNGEEGLNQAFAMLPDLIVSDIMMPEMNGIEMCRKIKMDQRISHIPVVLLTARTAEEQKLEGYETGADDYITKPFNFEILLSRMRNLILLREKFHKSFQNRLDVKASELSITPLDEKFIKNAIQCVEDNVSSGDFSVEDLSRHLGISRANLYKKVLSLTGKSPLEFIRTIRLQHAAQLLEKSQLTVAEVAYQVGFNNPKYFARYFKAAYHVLPSLYAAGKRKATE